MNTRRVLGIVATSIVLLAACATAQGGTKVPGWVLSVPAPDAANTWFVGSASDATGDVALASEDATANLVASIMNYMGARVTVDSSAEARGTLESYEAAVVQTVKSESTGRLAGFAVKERYVSREGGRVTVYILASYQTKELEKEKARIAAVFKEIDDAVAKPEAAGKAYLSEGRYVDAVRSFIEAAVAATGKDIVNGDIKVERNVNQARAAIAKLRLERVSSPESVSAGMAFPAPFVIRVLAGEGAAAPGVIGAAVFVSYPRRQASGRAITKTERLLSDKNGFVSFLPPPPDLVGKSKISFRLDLDANLDLVDGLPTRFDALKDALAEDLRGRSIEFDYNAVSMARTVPTGLAIVEIGDDGKPLPTNTAQNGVLTALSTERFRVGNAPVALELLLVYDDAAIIAAARKAYGTSIQRLIYGVVRIESARKDGTSWLANARGELRCVDLVSGIVLYAADKTSIAVGADEAAARRSAFSALGKDVFGKDLVSSLP